MPKARRAFPALLGRQCSMALFGACVFWVGLGPPDSALARAAYGNMKTAEGWAWSEKDKRWQDDCRKLSASFVEDLLTRAPWREQVPSKGVQVKGALIVGNVDLEDVKLGRPMKVTASRIEAAIKLDHAHTDSVVKLDGSQINGDFTADGLQAECDLSLAEGVTFKRGMTLESAKIDGYVDMTGASFGGKLDANGLQVGGDLYMRSEDENKASFKEVDLTGANIKDQIDMSGASFGGTLNANSLQVGGSLLMHSDSQNKASFKEVVLLGAKITGQISMIGASFDGTLNADSLQVGGPLLMYSAGQNKASFKDVMLRGAKITGQIAMSGATFDGLVNADSLQLGADLFTREARCAGLVVMVFAHVGSNLDLRGATLADLDLSGASVAGDLRLGGGYKSTVWTGKTGEPGTCATRILATWRTRRMRGRRRTPTPQKGTSTSMASPLAVSADLREKPNRKCARGAWSGGTIGCGATPTTAPRPMRNLLLL
jgi:uncharacterized protein YjbI with pentapeptide repeats